MLIKKFRNLFYSLKLLSNRYYLGFINGHSYLNNDQILSLKKLVGIRNIDTIKSFEKQFAELIGIGKAVSFAAGRMGFYTLMKELNIGKGDEVVLLGYTCSVMPNAVWRAGATPVFADIDPKTFGSCATEIEKVLSPNTKMIVAQHSFGIPCSIEPIVELAHSRKIFLLEDCAITLGSKIKGVTVGNFGDAALFSVDHSKPCNAFIGGLIYTLNIELYNKLKIVQKNSDDLSFNRQQAIWKKFLFERNNYNSKKYAMSLFKNKLYRLLSYEKDSYLTDDYGRESSATYPYPAILPTFLAQLGLYEINRWFEEKRKRQDLLSSYLHLSNSLGLRDFLPPSYFDKDLDIVPLRFVYTHLDSNIIRKKMSKFIDVSWFWFDKPIITCKDPSELGYMYGSCPVSEKISQAIINWPCVFKISDNQKLLKKFEIVHK